MFSKLAFHVKTQDSEYRKYYLATDIRRVKLAVFFYLLPIAGFVINDYQFFGWTTQFFSLVSLRIVLLSVIAVGFLSIMRVKSYRAYDTIIFLTVLVVMSGGGVINAMRPQDFIVQAIITIVSVFVMYLVVPFRFLYQSVLCTIATVGEALILLLIVKPSGATAVLFTVLFALFITNLIAALSSWELHSYRQNTYREIKKRKEIQEKLEEHTKNLEKIVEERTEKLKNAERFATIGSTAGMVGHDLRNPLSGISNAAYFLKKKYSNKLSKQGKEMLRIIESNVEYSNKIINDLLDYSGNIILDPKTKTNPKLMVSEALAMTSFPSNIELSNLTEETPELSVDLAKVKRVFINLIKNAVDAMPEGGRLTISSEKAGNFVRIAFRDNGSGILEEDQKKLFQPLFTTKAKGMGFGLAICQRIIEAHNGRVLVESSIGKGAVFTVELPFVE